MMNELYSKVKTKLLDSLMREMDDMEAGKLSNQKGDGNVTGLVIEQMNKMNPRAEEKPVYFNPDREKVLKEAENEGEEEMETPRPFKSWMKGKGY